MKKVEVALSVTVHVFVVVRMENIDLQLNCLKIPGLNDYWREDCFLQGSLFQIYSWKCQSGLTLGV